MDRPYLWPLGRYSIMRAMPSKTNRAITMQILALSTKATTRRSNGRTMAMNSRNHFEPVKSNFIGTREDYMARL